jgi:hypothetical protein
MVRHRLVMPLPVVLAVLGCSSPRALPVSRFRPPYRIEVHDAGAVVFDRAVPPGPEEEEISRWIQSHSAGWRPTTVTYAPVRRIRGSGFDLNFLEGRCVLNYRANPKGDWVQLSRSIESYDPVPAVFARND